MRRATNPISPVTDRRLEDAPVSQLFGVRVHRLTMEEAVAVTRRLLLSGGFHQIVTVNGPMLVQAARQARIRQLLNAVSLAIPDGVGVVIAARVLGLPPFVRVAGVDLVDRLCALCAKEGFRVHLLGAAAGVAEAAGRALQSRYAGLQIAGTHHGYFGPDEEAGLVESIRKARPHLLLVALGFPRQEEWIAAHRESLPSVCIGVGGTLDVFAGRVRRAPEWAQRTGLEWAYRLMQEPRRWRVIMSLPLLIALAVRERVKSELKMVAKRG